MVSTLSVCKEKSSFFFLLTELKKFLLFSESEFGLGVMVESMLLTKPQTRLFSLFVFGSYFARLFFFVHVSLSRLI